MFLMRFELNEWLLLQFGSNKWLLYPRHISVVIRAWPSYSPIIEDFIFFC
jgi:hypothetical protein